MKIVFSTNIVGYMCAAILCRANPKAVLVPYNYWYDYEMCFGSVTNNEKLIFAGITPKLLDLMRLMKVTTNIFIIDDHTTSMRELAGEGIYRPEMKTADEIGVSAAVWKMAYPNTDLPLSVRYVADYADWIRNDENKLFNFGLKSFNTMPTNNIWDLILTDDERFLQKIMNKGRANLAYLVPWYKRLVRSYAIPGYFNYDQDETLSAIFLNQANVDDSVFDSLEEEFDVYIRGVLGKSFNWLVNISTRRDNLDVSLLAEDFGGGGYDWSAGLMTDDIFKVIVPSPLLKGKPMSITSKDYHDN